MATSKTIMELPRGGSLSDPQESNAKNNTLSIQQRPHIHYITTMPAMVSIPNEYICHYRCFSNAAANIDCSLTTSHLSEIVPTLEKYNCSHDHRPESLKSIVNMHGNTNNGNLKPLQIVVYEVDNQNKDHAEKKLSDACSQNTNSPNDGHTVILYYVNSGVDKDLFERNFADKLCRCTIVIYQNDASRLARACAQQYSKLQSDLLCKSQGVDFIDPTSTITSDDNYVALQYADEFEKEQTTICAHDSVTHASGTTQYRWISNCSYCNEKDGVRPISSKVFVSCDENERSLFGRAALCGFPCEKPLLHDSTFYFAIVSSKTTIADNLVMFAISASNSKECIRKFTNVL